jgi:hypothetical protein
MSCESESSIEVKKLKYEMTVDTLYHDGLRFSGGDELKLLDIKEFNDTLFLFSIPNNQDTLSLFVFYWNNKFEFLKKHTFSHVPIPNTSDGSENSLTVINPDSVVILSGKTLYMYDFLRESIVYTFTISEDISLLARESPIQWSQAQNTVCCRYIDWAKPEDENGRTMTDNYLCINMNADSTISIPLIPELSVKALSINAREHFTLTDNALIQKLSYENKFNVFDFSTKKENSYPIPYFDSFLINEPEEEIDFDNLNYDNLKSTFMNSYIQDAFEYDKVNKRYMLSYLCPVSERNAEGKKPSLTERDYAIYIFDEKFNLLGEIIVDAQHKMLTTNCFAVNGKIYLISAMSKYTIIREIKYSL